MTRNKKNSSSRKPKSVNLQNQNKRNNNNSTKSRRPAASTSNPLSENRPIGRSTKPNNMVNGRDLIKTYETTSTSEFTAESVRLQPGLSSVFPTLSLEAKRWDRYRFRSLRFILEPSTGVATTPGTSFLVWDPNAGSSAPPDMATVAASEHAVSGSVWKVHTLDVPASKLSGWRYTSYGLSIPAVLYDAGLISLGTAGMSSSVILYLRAEYVVEFSDYQYGATGSGLVSADAGSYLDMSMGLVSGATPTFPAYETLPFSDTILDPEVHPTFNFGGLLREGGIVGNKYFDIPPGSYEFKLFITSSCDNYNGSSETHWCMTAGQYNASTNEEIFWNEFAQRPGAPITSALMPAKVKTDSTSWYVSSSDWIRTRTHLVMDRYNGVATTSKIRLEYQYQIRPVVS